jgi:hypothetical protein
MFKKTPKVEYDINKRWEKGTPHHPKSLKLMKRVNELDWELLKGSFDFKTGGDGDSGETLMYLLDIYFEECSRVA